MLWLHTGMKKICNNSCFSYYSISTPYFISDIFLNMPNVYCGSKNGCPHAEYHEAIWTLLISNARCWRSGYSSNYLFHIIELSELLWKFQSYKITKHREVKKWLLHFCSFDNLETSLHCKIPWMLNKIRLGTLSRDEIET